MKIAILLSIALLPFIVNAQVKGRVVTANDDGIPFATITVKNTAIATTADSLGYFSVNGIENFPVTLVVTFSGFEPEQKVVRENNTGNVIIRLQALFKTDTIVITSRRRRELLQDVPIPI